MSMFWVRFPGAPPAIDWHLLSGYKPRRTGLTSPLPPACRYRVGCWNDQRRAIIGRQAVSSIPALWVHNPTARTIIKGECIMSEQTAKRRLEEERQHLLFRLDRIGYVPDEDMRDALESIRQDLRKRIESLKDELRRS